MPPLLESHLVGWPCRRGKVRDVYDLGDRLAIVATDRISAFDWVLPTPIPDKGRVLTALTVFWLERLNPPSHLISTDLRAMPAAFQTADLQGRTCLVRKARVAPIECVVRGWLAGSGWKDYHATGSVCGVRLPPGLRQSEKLPASIFTPATKEEHGHDQNISFEEAAKIVGADAAAQLRDRSIDLYQRAADHAAARGVILADTKFEWGWTPDGSLILVDEVLTPDSSRFWPTDGWKVGENPPSFDKQYVRDWLDTTGWDKNSPPPALPEEVVRRTREKYLEAHERLTGRRLTS
ncbi:MAG TPA: phosphoribosylaminoimidazolesuccinocarboxamide synthase [Gemmataceae bacterium]|nr:phosphoribosylaminoimidazolesuccinocarboxamide synthase [Gemmataceae bacterium]